MSEIIDTLVANVAEYVTSAAVEGDGIVYLTAGTITDEDGNELTTSSVSEYTSNSWPMMQNERYGLALTPSGARRLAQKLLDDADVAEGIVGNNEE